MLQHDAIDEDTDHWEGMALKHFVLNLPFMRDKASKQSFAKRKNQRLARWCLEGPLVQRDCQSSCSDK